MKPPIGVVGLGIMGLAIAKNAQKAGFQVFVSNRSAVKREIAKREGLSVVNSPMEVAERAQAIIIMVTDPAAVEDVLTGRDGIFSSKNIKGKTLIQMSTIDEKSTLEFSESTNKNGMVYIDCPVAGSKKQVEEAQLILLAGGMKADLLKWDDLFKAIGKAVVHAGPVGKGSALKLCMNLIVAQMTTALCESVALAKVQDLNPEKIFEVIKQSPALNCGYFQIKEKTLLEENYSPAFSLKNMLKDVRFMDAVARQKKLPIPVTQAVKFLMEGALTEGLGDFDLTSISALLKPAGKK
ncbi:MAG: 2-hydroxy-3-oxopropionate reductase [Elusimicrobia bacterium]|nr:2-hydroxy-3-oxopropionate reductase [Elusimicrobiota bacterium]